MHSNFRYQVDRTIRINFMVTDSEFLSSSRYFLRDFVPASVASAYWPSPPGSSQVIKKGVSVLELERPCSAFAPKLERLSWRGHDEGKTYMISNGISDACSSKIVRKGALSQSSIDSSVVAENSFFYLSRCIIKCLGPSQF